MAHRNQVAEDVRAIVAYEPGSNFIFPNAEEPPPMPISGGPLEAVRAPQSEFMLLTKIPIIIFYGDNIPEKPMANPGQDWMACTSGDGEALGGRSEPSRR